jgi:FtsP/CotA-like multicopper oxidase with cupredoxin domain
MVGVALYTLLGTQPTEEHGMRHAIRSLLHSLATAREDGTDPAREAAREWTDEGQWRGQAPVLVDSVTEEMLARMTSAERADWYAREYARLRDRDRNRRDHR